MTTEKDNPDIQILDVSPSPTRDRKIRFKTYERFGPRVWEIIIKPREDGSDWEPVIKPLLAREDLVDGKAILIWSGHNTSGKDFWHTELVKEEPAGYFFTRLSEHCFRAITFDEEQGWIEGGTINMNGIERLGIIK